MSAEPSITESGLIVLIVLVAAVFVLFEIIEARDRAEEARRKLDDWKWPGDEHDPN